MATIVKDLSSYLTTETESFTIIADVVHEVAAIVFLHKNK